MTLVYFRPHELFSSHHFSKRPVQIGISGVGLYIHGHAEINHGVVDVKKTSKKYGQAVGFVQEHSPAPEEKIE